LLKEIFDFLVNIMTCSKEAVYIDRFLCIRAEGVKDDLAMETGDDASTADTAEEEGEDEDNSGDYVHVVVVET
jgi:hypothetical protein